MLIKPELLAVALLLAVANKAIVDYLTEPIRKKYPNLDLWFVIYIAFLTGGAIGWLANFNLFDGIAPGLTGITGRILTACFIGGGSSLIHNLTDHEDVRTTTTEVASVSPAGVLTTETESIASSDTLNAAIIASEFVK